MAWPLPSKPPYRSFSMSWFRLKRQTLILVLFSCLVIAFVARRGPLIQPSVQTNYNKKNNEKVQPLSYEELQQCVDDYTSRGSWMGSIWNVPNHPPACRFHTFSNHTELASTFRRVKVGFVGDSTTRSDLRAWEETFLCPRTNLDEAQVFQRKNASGKYICKPSEQSMNLTKCGIPPVINVTNCPSGVSFRYMYKIYPWTPLDEWYLWQQPHMFRDLDVLIISLGRWFVYYQPSYAFNITDQFETFLVELKKVFSGVILYQSEYPGHLTKSAGIQSPVPCTPHVTCKDCGTEPLECSLTDDAKRPKSDAIMRSVLERHRILHLDRWNVSQTLPLEYFQPWYCQNGTFHQWYCSHHLGFVALQHMRLIANVIQNLFVWKQNAGLME